MFKFSVVIAIRNSDVWLKESIGSIINQSLDFKDNIQIILVNDASLDLSEDICLKYKAKYPHNIKYIANKEHLGVSQSRNLGLKHATGEYVTFIDSDDFVSLNAFFNVYNFFKKYDEMDIVSIPIFFKGDKKGEHILNFKYEKNQVVDLTKNPNYIQLSASSSFFKREKIKDLEFDPRLYISEDVTFINQLLLENPKIGFCKDAKYFYRKRLNKTSVLDNALFDKYYFIPRLKYYFKYLIDESLKYYSSVPLFIQYTLMYDLQWIFEISTLDNILDDGEYIEFKKLLYDILQYIDDEVICSQFGIANDLKAHIVYYKHWYEIKNNHEDISNNLIEKLDLNTVYLDIFEIKDDVLYIMGVLKSYFVDIDIYCIVDGEKVKTNKIDFPQRKEYSLGNSRNINNNFEISISLTKDKHEISFDSSLDNFDNLNIDFSRPCNFSKITSYQKSENFLSILKDNSIIIKPYKTRSWIKQEIKTLKSMFAKHEQGFRTGIILRALYLLLYPFLYKKHIWLFMDRPFIADDNGKILYEYAIKQDENVKKYFVVGKGKYFDEVSKWDGAKIIPFNSIRHKLLGLFAEKIITSHPDNSVIYPFWGNYPHFAGILKSQSIFLQHGVTKDNVSSWLKKYDINLSMLVTVSKKELESFLRYPYHYDKQILKLTGFPRFDKLNNDIIKKQIVIMPSWRRYLKNRPEEFILTSKYFITFDSLINNKKLHEACEKYGYEIIFKPHPNTYEFIDLFDSDYVKIDYENKNYVDFFNFSSLLITDYSSVAFDFAYLKKPVLYYHYSDDYHFDLKESYFDYESMGFGEIANDEDTLVSLIIGYMENDCNIKEKYLKNIKNFFSFDDNNSCKRVYNEIKKL